jgi:hypothetical protein
MNTEEIIEAIDAEIKRLEQARELLNGTPAKLRSTGGMSGGGKQRISAGGGAGVGNGSGRRTMSAAGRARIAAAQKERWAKAKRKA